MLYEPIWLILLLPLAITLYVWRIPTRLLLTLRIILLALLVVIMADPALKISDRRGTVVVVADRSASMPDHSSEQLQESIDIIQDSMPAENALAVVSFGEEVVVDKTPDQHRFEQWLSELNPHGSNLSAALEKAAAMIEPGTSGRIVVLSDGRWTGATPDRVLSTLLGRDIPLDYRLVSRTIGRDLAITAVQAPQKVMPGQAWLITAWLDSPEAGDINYELVRGNIRIAHGRQQIKPGRNRLVFRDRAGPNGIYDYQLKIDGFSDDPIKQNNRARFLTRIEGPRPLLALSESGQSSLAELLRKDGLPVVSQEPGQAEYDLSHLSGYSAVLIEDVDAGDIGTAGMDNLAAWVTAAGTGLIMTGGPHSYGPGGYFRSPLEPIMPVSMELRREHRKMKLAVVVVLDRSGSMGMGVGNGRTKMDLANAASVQVLDLLSPGDEFGVVAVDSVAHTISRCTALSEDNRALRKKILSIESGGGGIFVYEGLSKAASLLLEAQAETRHIILFADANDSEQPGDYLTLLEKCRQAGITASVVGLGTDYDQDAPFLMDVAQAGDGRIYFTENAVELPRLFAQDTFMVARNSFIDEPVQFKFMAGIQTLMDIDSEGGHQLGGYNLCYLRPDALLSAATTDDYAAPILATWQAGIGRTAAFCGQADGHYAGQFARETLAGRYYSSLARWAIGDDQGLGPEILVTQSVDKGNCQVQIHIDPDLEQLPFDAMPVVRVLRERPGIPTQVQQQICQLISTDKLVADIPLYSDHTVLITVDAGQAGRVILPPVCLPYSPEYQPRSSDRSGAALPRLARMSGGNQLTDLASIWQTIKPRPVYFNLTPWLAVAAVILFLIEILERRSGFISALLSLRRGRGGTSAAALEAEEAYEQTPIAKTDTISIIARTRKTLSRVIPKRNRTTPASDSDGQAPSLPSRGGEAPDNRPATDNTSARANSEGILEAFKKIRKR